MKNYSNYNELLKQMDDALEGMVQWAIENDQDCVQFIRMGQHLSTYIDNIVSFGQWDDRTEEIKALNAWVNERNIALKEEIQNRNERQKETKRKAIEAQIAKLQGELDALNNLSK